MSDRGADLEEAQGVHGVRSSGEGAGVGPSDTKDTRDGDAQGGRVGGIALSLLLSTAPSEALGAVFSGRNTPRDGSWTVL